MSAFIVRTVVTAASLWVADYLLEGISFEAADDTGRIVALVVSAVVLGVLNALVRPVLMLISLPITIVTLGLFILVINGVLLWLLSLLPFTGFRVDGLLAAILGGIVVSVVSFVLNLVIRD